MKIARKKVCGCKNYTEQYFSKTLKSQKGLIGKCTFREK
jgi:hypothetical protein